MHVLLIHQNFPGQFRELAPAWIARGHRVSAIGSSPALPCRAAPWNQLHYFPYHCPDHHWRAQVVANHLQRLIQQHQLQPDVVLAHSGWGEAMAIKEILPKTPLVVYPELWGSARALGEGFDLSQCRLSEADLRAIRLHNHCTRMALGQADAVVAPTVFQRDSFPAPWRQRMQLIHEGIDCDRLRPDPRASLLLPNGQLLDHCDRVISYVSRHFEPLRGLHTFLAALPALLEADPRTHVVMVGGSGDGYGPAAQDQAGHLAHHLALLPETFDHNRLHIVGYLPYNELRTLFQISSAHVYLTYPYTLSWSPLEAMACAAPLVANHGRPGSGPLDELIHDGENGLLVDFNRPHQLASALTRLLDNPALARALGKAARQTVISHYSLSLALERYETLFLALTAGDQSLSQTSR